MGTQILGIIACYAVGLIAGNLILMPYYGPVTILLAVGGAVLALPILALVVLTFALLKNRILRNLSLWCVTAPFLITLTWLIIDWELDYSSRGQDIWWYLSLRSVRELAALAFRCSSISSALFWYWNRPPRSAVHN